MIVGYRSLLKKTLTMLDNLPARSVDSVRLEQEIKEMFEDTYVCPDCEESTLEPHDWQNEYHSQQQDCALCGRTWTVVKPVL